MGRLTTHVLDTAQGRPAAGLKVELYRVGQPDPVVVGTTDGDGRLGDPLLDAEGMRVGTYELVFHAADYLRAQGLALADPPFLDRVVIRFGIADPQEHYHVPLLLSPFGYSTYRGS
jgi:5-hydroxyisourate hydrolase